MVPRGLGDKDNQHPLSSPKKAFVLSPTQEAETPVPGETGTQGPRRLHRGVP